MTSPGRFATRIIGRSRRTVVNENMHIELPGVGKMAYRRHGTGFPLVMLHPVGLDLSFWEPLIPFLPSGYEIFMPDFRGHGQSDPGAAPFSLEDLATDVLRFCSVLKLEQVILCGISMGGMVAQKVALADPARVSGLILANTTAKTIPELMTARASAVQTGGMGAVLQETLERWFTAETLAGNTGVVKRVKERLLTDDPRTHEWAWRAMANMNVAGRIREIRCPVLILCGEHDRSTTPEIAKEMAANMEKAVYAEISDASHMAFLEQPRRFAEAIKAFLNQHKLA